MHCMYIYLSYSFLRNCPTFPFHISCALTQSIYVYVSQKVLNDICIYLYILSHSQVDHVHIGLCSLPRASPGTRRTIWRKRNSCCRWMVWNCAILSRALCQCLDVLHLLYSVPTDVMFIRLVIFVSIQKNEETNQKQTKKKIRKKRKRKLATKVYWERNEHEKTKYREKKTNRTTTIKLYIAYGFICCRRL